MVLALPVTDSADTVTLLRARRLEGRAERAVPSESVALLGER